MYPRSSRFDTASIASHEVAVQVICTEAGGRVIWDSAGTNISLTIIDGEVTATTDAIRRQATLTLVGELSDTLLDELLLRTTSWQLKRGITYADQTVELGSLGIFTAADCALDDSGRSKRIRLTLADRSLDISEHFLTEDFSFAGDPVQAAIALLRVKNPSLSIVGAATGPYPSTRNVFTDMQSDPWAKALELLRDAGMEAYFDVFSRCVIREVPNIATQQPVWEFREGVNSTFMNIQRTSSRRKYNHVIVTSEAPGLSAPIVGHAYDTDKGSPSYFYGATGDVPYFVRSDSIVTQSQADQVAYNMLQKIVGRKDSVTISCLPHPFFEVGDIVYLQRASTGTTGYYLIDRISIPLVYDRPMYLTLRRGRSVG